MPEEPNNATIARIKETGDIFFAESDRDWVLDGANVHVSMVGFDNGSDTLRVLDGKPVAKISSSLTAGTDLTVCREIGANKSLAYQGVTPAGPFMVDEETAIRWLHTPSPNLKPNSDVLRPYLNATDIVRLNARNWIIDFGIDTSEQVAAQYASPYEHARETVKPFRDTAKSSERDDRWWLHLWGRHALRTGMRALGEIIVTPRVSKHRIFISVPSEVLISDATVGILLNGPFSFGALQSRPHEVWALRTGTRLETRPRYTPTSCFETFPFPDATAAQRDAIAAAARELDTLRSNWLNPPEWTREEVLTFPGSVDGPWARYVTAPNAKGIGTVRYPRAVPADDAAAKKLAKRTLTNLYNERPTWLDLAHKRLDEAVFAAYGWPANLSDEELLAQLLSLNLEQAAKT